MQLVAKKSKDAELLAFAAVSLKFEQARFAAMLQEHFRFERETPVAMRKVLRPVAVMLLGAVCLLCGCKRPAASNGLFPVTLQTDWYPQPEHGGFYEALLKGYYKQEGLDVKIVPGGPMIVADQQVATGAATFCDELVRYRAGFGVARIAGGRGRGDVAARSPGRDGP